MNTIIDIIERSQMRHALHEEHELQNLDALSPALLLWLKPRDPKQTECEYRQSQFQEGRNGRPHTMAEIDWS